MRRTLFGATVAALLCALAVAIAVPASASRAEGPEPTAASYRAQANAICQTEVQELNAVPSNVSLAVYLTKALQIAHSSFGDLKRLKAPAALVSLNAQVLANISAGFPIVNRLLDRARAGKLTLTQFEQDKALTANAAREAKLWKELGAKTCAS